MGLCNVYNFSNKRTVKLSDSYGVQIKLTDLDMAKFKSVVGKYAWADEDLILTLPECVNVTLPEVILKSETYKYGNNSKVFVYPDYEKPDDLKIDLIEHVVEKYTDTSMQYIGIVELLVNIFLSKLFDAATFSYKLNDYIPELRVIVYSNDFTKPLYYYVFQNLKLSSYSKYSLDYSSADICKWSLVFSYQSYYQEYEKDISDSADKLFGKNKSISYFSDARPAEPAEPPMPQPTIERPAEEPEPTTTETADNNTKAVDTPVDNNADKIDELAYHMMRGDLGNGKARKDAARAQGFNDDEIKAAQGIVNQKDWNALKARHDARVAGQTPVETPPSNSDIAGIENAATLANAKDLANATPETSIVMKSDTNKNNKLSAGNDDRIDELAYQMMRGTYDNGNPRIKKVLAAEYTKEERKAAQQIVNKKEWNALKDRHDARVAAENERKTEALANANNGLTREPVQCETEPVIANTSNNLGGDAAANAYQAALAKASENKTTKNDALAGMTGNKPKGGYLAGMKKETEGNSLAGMTGNKPEGGFLAGMTGNKPEGGYLAGMKSDSQKGALTGMKSTSQEGALAGMKSNSQKGSLSDMKPQSQEGSLAGMKGSDQKGSLSDMAKTENKKSKTETISSKTTTSNENGKPVTKTTTVAQFEGFDPVRERKIADYAAGIYTKALSSGKVKNEQIAYEKAMLEAETAYAQGKIK